jgi:hypothetical protein
MECIRDIGGKARRKDPLGRPRRRWVDNIKMDLREIGWGRMDWIDLAEDRGKWRDLVNAVMKHRVSLNTGKFLNSCTIGGFSRRPQLHDVRFKNIVMLCNFSLQETM